MLISSARPFSAAFHLNEHCILTKDSLALALCEATCKYCLPSSLTIGYLGSFGRKCVLTMADVHLPLACKHLVTPVARSTVKSTPRGSVGKGNLRKCWQFPISFCRRVSRFWGVSDKSGTSLFLPCSHKHAVACWGFEKNSGVSRDFQKVP